MNGSIYKIIEVVGTSKNSWEKSRKMRWKSRGRASKT